MASSTLSSFGMLAGLAARTPASSAFPSVRPDPCGDRAVFGLVNSDSAHIRTTRCPQRLGTGNTEDKHKAGIPQSSSAAHAGTHPGLFATIITVNLTMAVFTSLS